MHESRYRRKVSDFAAREKKRRPISRSAADERAARGANTRWDQCACADRPGAQYREWKREAHLQMESTISVSSLFRCGGSRKSRAGFHRSEKLFANQQQCGMQC